MNIYILSAFEDSMRKETGGSVRIYNLAKALAATGNNVHVVLPNFETNSKIVDGIAVHELKGLLPKAVLKAVGNRAHIVRPSSFYFYDFLFILKTLPKLREADVVQIEQPILGIALIPFIQKILKKSVALDCHDVFQAVRVKQTGPLRRILETFLEKLAYKNANIILTVSEKEKQLLISSGVQRNKIFVAPNGVDTDSFQKTGSAHAVRTRYGLGDSQIIVFLGNLSYLPNREAIELISSKIAPQVKAEIAEAKFMVIGKTPKDLHLPHIHFTGFVDDVAGVLATANVGIAPLLHGSGTRLKILEYFSSGIPVVSTSVGAEGLQVKHEQNILIVDDLENFAVEIVRLLEDDELCLSLGKAGKETAAKYDWKKIATQLASDYRNFLSQQKGNK